MAGQTYFQTIIYFHLVLVPFNKVESNRIVIMYYFITYNLMLKKYYRC